MERRWYDPPTLSLGDVLIQKIEQHCRRYALNPDIPNQFRAGVRALLTDDPDLRAALIALATPHRYAAFRQQVRQSGWADLDVKAWAQATDANTIPRVSYSKALRKLAGEQISRLGHEQAIQRGISDMDAYEVLKRDPDPKVQALFAFYATVDWS